MGLLKSFSVCCALCSEGTVLVICLDYEVYRSSYFFRKDSGVFVRSIVFSCFLKILSFYSMTLKHCLATSFFLEKFSLI